MFVMCLATVRMLSTSSREISALVRPAAIKRRASISRVERAEIKRALDAPAALCHPRASGLHVCRSYSIAPGHSGPNVNQVCRIKLGTRTINVLAPAIFPRRACAMARTALLSPLIDLALIEVDVIQNASDVTIACAVGRVRR